MLKTLHTLLFWCLLASTSLCQQQLTPEQERLSVFKGKWTVPGSDSTYLEICDFIQGNHIRCCSFDKGKDKTDSATSFLSYLASESEYVYYGLYSSGSSRTLRGKWDTDRFIFNGQRITPQKTTKWRVTIIPIGGDIHFIEEVSVNDGSWEKKADFIYKRLQ